jgi:hypothetical protein
LTGPGQVIGHDSAHNIAVIAGANGEVLLSDSTVPSGLRFAPPNELQLSFDSLAPTRIKGDLIAFDGATNVRFGVPNMTGLVLTVDPLADPGVSWQPPKGLSFGRKSYAQTPVVLAGTETLVGISVPSVNSPIHVILAGVGNLTTNFLIIKDETGTADQFPITLSTNDGTLIQGQLTYVIDIPYGKVFVYSNGFSFFVL